jgi:lipopolysaccharide export system protein LptA
MKIHIIIAAFVALGGFSAFAAETKARRAPTKKADRGALGAMSQEPIFVTADRMEVEHKKNSIVYRGRVQATQGDLIMQSDVLTAIYHAEMKGIREIVAEGSVRVTQGEHVATGERAVYNGSEQTITLTGNPSVRRGSSQVSGARIVVSIAEDRAVVEGGQQRVRATIYPDELQERSTKEKRSVPTP